MNAQDRRQCRTFRRQEDVTHARLASLVRAAPVAITSETLDGRILSWNDAAEQLYGYTAREAVGAPASFLVPPEHYEEERRVREGVVRERSAARLDTARRRKNGSIIPVALELAPFFGPERDVVSVCIVARPLARAQSKPPPEAGARDRDHLATALAASGAGAFRCDVATDECEYDQAFARLWELRDRITNARTVFDRVHPDDRQPLLAAFDRSTREGTDFELEHRLAPPSDAARWLLTKGKTFADPGGRVCYMTGVSVDITRGRRAEEALRQSEERFRGMAEAIPSIVWESDAKGRTLYKNRVWFDYTGQRTRPESAGDWLRFYHPDDRDRLQREWRERAPAQGIAPLDTEARVRRRDGVYRWFRIRAAPIRDHGGTIVRWAGTCTDIDDQKRAAQALEEADRHKNEFIAMLAHELRNPLASIRNATEIVKMSGAERERLKYAIDVIDRQTDRLGRLIADLLDLSNISRGKLALRREPCDLLAVVRDALEMNRPAIERKGHRLEPRLPAMPVVLIGDASRLVQLVSNLIENAAKYTPEGGVIHVAVRPQGDRVRLRVCDTGRGIDPALLPRIFDLFVHGEQPLPRAEGGLGIGLALVKQIAAMHGGSVTARNRATRQGAEFIVSLPLATGKATNAETGGDGHAAGKAAAQRVLIVDDNRDYADSLAMLLQQLGHETLALYRSADALERAAGFAPHVMLLDIGLSDIDGAELCRRLRQEPALRHAVYVAISGFDQPADRGKTRAAGFAHHLLKPVRLDDLLPILSSPGGH